MFVIFSAQAQGMNNDFNEATITDVIKKIYSTTPSYKYSNGWVVIDVNESEIRRRAFQDIYELIADNPTALSNQKKLKYVFPDEYWWFRKEIIIDMIENEHIKPDTIHYICTTPLQESVFYKDLAFTKYLLEKGSTVTKEVKNEETSQEITDLLEQHLTQGA